MSLYFSLNDQRAVVPSKAHHDDIGFDLTIIDIAKTISDRITMFETGVAVKPPHGYYTEVIPRSSFSKSGHVIANSIGVIDPQYRGTIKIVVIKVDEKAEPLKLPYTGFQLVLRKAETCAVEVVDELDQTARGDGGFGSTDKLEPPGARECAFITDVKCNYTIHCGMKVDEITNSLNEDKFHI
jgi:dUTP pyrophosphatase